jgi:hypothetical protein
VVVMLKVVVSKVVSVEEELGPDGSYGLKGFGRDEW